MSKTDQNQCNFKKPSHKTETTFSVGFLSKSLWSKIFSPVFARNMLAFTCCIHGFREKGESKTFVDLI